MLLVQEMLTLLVSVLTLSDPRSLKDGIGLQSNTLAGFNPSERNNCALVLSCGEISTENIDEGEISNLIIYHQVVELLLKDPRINPSCHNNFLLKIAFAAAKAICKQKAICKLLKLFLKIQESPLTAHGR